MARRVTGRRECRVLSNAKCLTEGVDVPALDAVVFLHPRGVVDVVQAVGGSMRKPEGKHFGYVILPIAITRLRCHPRRRYATTNATQSCGKCSRRSVRTTSDFDADDQQDRLNQTSSKVSEIGIDLAGGDETDGPGVTTTADGAADAARR